MQRSKASGAETLSNFTQCSSQKYPRRWTKEARAGSAVRNSIQRTETRRTLSRGTSSRSTMTTSAWMLTNGLLELSRPVRPAWRTRRGHTLTIGHVYGYGIPFRVQLDTMSSKQSLVRLEPVPESSYSRGSPIAFRSTCSARRSSRSRNSSTGRTSKARG